jgi:hypothetical protein
VDARQEEVLPKRERPLTPTRAYQGIYVALYEERQPAAVEQV